MYGRHEGDPNAKVRFVVLSHGRCGSTLLQSTLDSHPDAEVFNEVFHESQDDRARFLRARGQFYPEGGDVAKFVSEVVFGGSPPSVRAVGFKLMYYQGRGGDRSLLLWDLLRRDTDIRVVHVCRWNLLECYCSHEVARRSQQWSLGLRGERRIQVPPFRIEPLQFIGFCESVLSWPRWTPKTGN